MLIQKPNVVYANSRTFLSFLCPFFSRRSILISHDCEPPSTWYGKIVFRLVAKLYSFHRVNTPYEEEILVRLGVRRKKIRYVPLAIDNDFYSRKYSEAEKSKIKKKYGLSNKNKYVSFVANFRSHKTPVVLLKAINHFKDTKIKIILVGEDQLLREGLKPVKKLIEELNVKSKVFHLENLEPSQVREILAITEVYCHPTFREGQCLAVYEAAAAGKPLCLADIGSFNSVFQESAYFHSKYDEKTLAENIEKALKNTENNKKYAEINRKIVHKTAYTTVYEGMKKLLKDVTK